MPWANGYLGRVDPAERVKNCPACGEDYDDNTSCGCERGAELADQLERAIRWAVRLEGENARLEVEIAELRAHVEQSSDAWFGAWRCGCSDTERTPAGIPEFCPLHGASMICNLAGQTKVRLNHAGVSGYGFHRGPRAAS